VWSSIVSRIAKNWPAAYNIKGMTVREPRLLRDAIAETLAHPGPVLLDVRVSREENVYPIIPAGGALSDII